MKLHENGNKIKYFRPFSDPQSTMNKTLDNVCELYSQRTI